MRQLLPAAGTVDQTVDLFTAYAWPEPGVRVNFVASADGAATVDGRAGGLSSPADQALLHLLRAMSDVVLVGAGTVRVERYGPLRPSPGHQRWRRAHGLDPVPPLAVVSGSLNLDPDGPFFTAAAARPLVLTVGESPADRRHRLARVADILVADSVEGWLALLVERGLARILCEGGPHLFGQLLAADLVDELCLTLAPLLVPQPALKISVPTTESTPHRLALQHVLEDDGFLFLRYAAKDG